MAAATAGAGAGARSVRVNAAQCTSRERSGACVPVGGTEHAGSAESGRSCQFRTRHCRSTLGIGVMIHRRESGLWCGKPPQAHAGRGGRGVALPQRAVRSVPQARRATGRCWLKSHCGVSHPHLSQRLVVAGAVATSGPVRPLPTGQRLQRPQLPPLSVAARCPRPLARVLARAGALVDCRVRVEAAQRLLALGQLCPPAESLTTRAQLCRGERPPVHRRQLETCGGARGEGQRPCQCCGELAAGGPRRQDLLHLLSGPAVCCLRPPAGPGWQRGRLRRAPGAVKTVAICRRVALPAPASLGSSPSSTRRRGRLPA